MNWYFSILKRTFVLNFLFILINTGYSQVNFTIPSGDGTEGNPYEIATLDDLAWVMQSDTAWNKYFIQIANIDASQTNQWYDGEGFSPIGSSTIKFTGNYNGKGYTISNLTIYRPEQDHIGLFGYIEDPAKIDSLGLISANVTGKRYVGVMVSFTLSGSISNSYTTGLCASNTSPDWWSRTGGFVGENRAEIKSSYSNVSVNSNKGMTGGFAGANLGTISNSYSDGDVTGTGPGRIGGFVGENDSEINYCYSIASVDCDDTATGGFSGYNDGNIQNSFWDKETSGQNSSDGGYGLTTQEMNSKEDYYNAGWDFMNESYNGSEDFWGINSTDNNSYPFLKWQGFINDSYTCQAPFSPVSNIIINNILNTSATISSFEEGGYGTVGYAIYINNEDNWTVPADGNEPTPNTQWQNNGQQCVYFGVSTNPNVSISNLEKCIHYYIKVYAYNECSSLKLFEQTGELADINPRDDIAPIPDISVLPDLVEPCSIIITNNPTATDNCLGSVIASTNDPLTYNEQGSYVITWIYDDENGNVSTQQQNVLINDDVNPTLTCVENQNRTIPPSESNYTVIGTEFDPLEVNDNCQIASITNNINNSNTLEGALLSLGNTSVAWTIVDNNGNTKECSFHVTVSQSTGIKELLEVGIKIYPNPVEDLLNISTNAQLINRLTIIDLSGKIVLDKKGSNSEKINLSNLNSGLYLINLYINNEIYPVKIIKK